MKIKDITPESLKTLTTQQLMETHRKLHMLFSGAKKRGIHNPDFYKLLIEKHNIVVQEIQRRGFKHISPLTSIMPRKSLLEGISYDLTIRQIKNRAKKNIEKIKQFFRDKRKQTIEDLKARKKQLLYDLKNELLLGKINHALFEKSKETIVEELESTLLEALEDYKIAERQAINRIAREEAQQVVRTAYRLNLDDIVEKGIELYYKAMKKISIITAIVIVSNKLYRDYFSISGRACKGRYGLDRERCIKEFKRQALQERKRYIQTKMQECQKSENPEECIGKLNKEINSINAKIAALQL